MIFLDTETCGLHGPIVLIQYAEIDDEPTLYCPWESPVYQTMELIERFTDSDICAFNLSFDWFHICQMYTTLTLVQDKYEFLNIEEYAALERQARYVDLCLKPKGACDLMLHARKGEFQTLMARRPMTVRKVPLVMANEVAAEVSSRLDIPDIYFAGSKDFTRRWEIKNISPCGKLCDLELKFNPSGKLKSIAQHILGEKTLIWDEISIDSKLMPKENAIAPFGGNWPNLIQFHIEHWMMDAKARKYAANDVEYLKKLWIYFDRPEPGDIDSTLAAMVSSVRWSGLALDVERLGRLIADYEEQAVSVDDINVNSAPQCQEYLRRYMSEEEIEAVKINGKFSTNKAVLTHLASKTIKNRCECGGINPECECKGSGLICTGKQHPVAERAQSILDLRFIMDRIELLQKLRKAGRFHVDLNVIGTRSSRMSGWGLTISHDEAIRRCFPLADEGQVLSGGDFDAFEVSIMDAAYKDEKLHRYLLEKKKIHGIFGAYLFDTTYDAIMESQDKAGMANLYARAKNGVFAMCYGGEADTLVNRVAISPEQAEISYERWCRDFPGWASERKKIFDRFCSMRQKVPGGQVTWSEPDNSIKSMFGFERRFDLENDIARVMFELSNDPPKSWYRFKGSIVRQTYRGEQQLIGALRSALYATAFASQAANMRAAANHVIQSSGSTVLKQLQGKLWDFQPVGIHPWCVKTLSIHDEVMTVHKDDMNLTDVVDDFVEEIKDVIPLIGMDWKTNVPSWGDK